MARTRNAITWVYVAGIRDSDATFIATRSGPDPSHIYDALDSMQKTMPYPFVMHHYMLAPEHRDGKMLVGGMRALLYPDAIVRASTDPDRPEQIPTAWFSTPGITPGRARQMLKYVELRQRESHSCENRSNALYQAWPYLAKRDKIATLLRAKNHLTLEEFETVRNTDPELIAIGQT